MIEKIAPFYVKIKQNSIAKKVRDAMLSIPFYREKLRENSIEFSEVRRINSIEKLDNFLQKYKVNWVEGTDLMGNDFSSHLSLVPQNKRTWVQVSSGYSLVERLRSGESFLETIKKFKRKKIAYTQKDVNTVIKELYLRGLRRFFANISTPSVAIFSRMYIYGGSGTYPFASLMRVSQKIPLRVLPYGEPLSHEQLCDYVLDSIENDANGVLITPSILRDIGTFMVENKLRYKNLMFIGTGGFKPSKEVIDLGHEIGAKIVIDAYGAQECMPLGCVAYGIISSVDRNWEASDSLMVMGNLCHIRVVDEKGENVSEGEEGEIKITSPFEGTCLIDYAPGDVTRLVSYSTTITLNNQKITLPFPSLSIDIRRKHESGYVKIKEYPVSVDILKEILTSYAGYNFAICKPQTKEELLILIPSSMEERNYEEMCKKIRYTVCPLRYSLLRFKKIDEGKLREIVFPSLQFKPHNLILSPSKELESELYAS
ncbi:MAG: hypothetical protein QXS48_04665 [Candidatus Aenigmatarchaeota archaeon]